MDKGFDDGVTMTKEDIKKIITELREKPGNNRRGDKKYFSYF